MLLRIAKVGHRRCTKPDGGLLVERSITTSNASITRRSYGSNPAPATIKYREKSRYFFYFQKQAEVGFEILPHANFVRCERRTQPLSTKQLAWYFFVLRLGSCKWQNCKSYNV